MTKLIRTKPKIFRFCALVLLLRVGFFCGNTVEARENHPTVLMVVIDGLRPDYISPELMPNLDALGQSGVVAQRHHSVFPSVTRVNASSIATGSYPAAHGILQNTIFLPAVSSNPIDTADATALLEVETKTSGHLLTAPSLGELMEKKGKRLFVAGSSSTGASLLLNHKLKGDGIWNSRGLVKPGENQARAEKLLGSFPGESKPSRKGNRWAIQAVLENVGNEASADVIILWLTDPDGVEHGSGVGSPETLEAVRHVDAEVGYLLNGLKARGLKDKINIFVTTDHGFSSYTGGVNLQTLLSDRGQNGGINIVSNQIHVKNRDEEKIKTIVRVLQETVLVGAIFTRAEKPGSAHGFVSGTLSFDLIHWNHDRAADILVDSDWTDQTNAFGYRGTTANNGIAGHGTSSPFDLNIRLIASGPDFKRGLRSDVPTGNIDLAPTILHLLGIKAPQSMNGRILKELLRNGPSPDKVEVKEIVERAAHNQEGKTYEVGLKKLVVGDTDYIDFAKVHRKNP